MNNTPITKDDLLNAAMITNAMDKSKVLNPAYMSKNFAKYETNPQPLQQWLEDSYKLIRSRCTDEEAAEVLETLQQQSQEDPAAGIGVLIALEAIQDKPNYKSSIPIYKNKIIDNIHSVILATCTNELKIARENKAAMPPIQEPAPAPAAPGSPANDKTLLQKLIELKPELNKDRYPWVDIGFSRLFSDIYINECRYNSTAKCWYFYDGKRWKKDQDGKRVEALAKEFYHGLVSYCASQNIDQNVQQPYLNEVCKLGKFNPRATVIKDAASDNYFVYEDLDKDPNLFNCQNGVFNLKTMTFTPGHSPDQLFSKISNVIYDPNADSKEWEKFINEVMQGDKDKIEYLQKVLGYSLTADTDEECLWFWYGEKSRNGKSTTAETYSYMMGNAEGYAAAVDPNTLAQKQNNDSSRPNGDIACLEGVRFLNVSEPPKNMIFNAALVKKLTGGNRIKARDNYEKFHEYNPIFKIIIDTNYLPIVLDDTLFLSGRVIVITFDRVFSEAEQDHTLKDRLRTPQNISGLFNWCLEGLKKYRQEGLKKPDSIREATELYQNNSDKVNMFITECMDKTFGVNTKGKEVYQRYKEWCYDCGYSPEGQQNFFGTLRKKNLLGTGTVAGVTFYNVMLNHTIKLK